MRVFKISNHNNSCLETLCIWTSSSDGATYINNVFSTQKITIYILYEYWNKIRVCWILKGSYCNCWWTIQAKEETMTLPLRITNRVRTNFCPLVVVLCLGLPWRSRRNLSRTSKCARARTCDHRNIFAWFSQKRAKYICHPLSSRPSWNFYSCDPDFFLCNFIHTVQ
jgi:hypothetical protein